MKHFSELHQILCSSNVKGAKSDTHESRMQIAERSKTEMEDVISLHETASKQTVLSSNIARKNWHDNSNFNMDVVSRTCSDENLIIKAISKAKLEIGFG